MRDEEIIFVQKTLNSNSLGVEFLPVSIWRTLKGRKFFDVFEYDITTTVKNLKKSLELNIKLKEENRQLREKLRENKIKY
jgi:hypothetical protein